MMRPPVDERVWDLALFAAVVAAAALQDWSATDLVWSLWISSLVVGYAFIVVTTLVGNGLTGRREAADLPGVLRLPLALFTLGFFTVHFLGFHWGHSVFLNQFFPLVETSGGPGGPIWWGELVGTAVGRYWPFLLATAVSRRGDFARSVRADPDRDEMLFQPYRNVVRMHLLIFVYAGLEAAGATGWFLYAVLLFYFFPLGALKEMVTGRRAAAEV